MGSKSEIEWTDASWTPIRARNRETGKVGWHCEHVSRGCGLPTEGGCYAEALNLRLGTGLPFKPGHRKDIEIFLDTKMINAPLRWTIPKRIFVNSMTDSGASFVTDAMLDRMFAVMALSPQHTYQVLSKRPERLREYLTGTDAFDRIVLEMMAYTDGGYPPVRMTCAKYGIRWVQPKSMWDWWPLRNVWVGTSCEDQATANQRIPHLLATTAAVRFLSCEPLLGEIDIASPYTADSFKTALAQDERRGIAGRAEDIESALPGLHWVIAGGESGRNARPMHPDWVRALRDQCAFAGVSFFFKQWGEFAPGEIAGDFLDPEKAAKGKRLYGDEWHDCWSEPEGHVDDEPDVYRIGKARAGRTLDGNLHDAMPTVSP